MLFSNNYSKNSLPFANNNAMSAHTAVVFTRYMMLSLESREADDQRSTGEILLYFTDDMNYLLDCTD